MLVLETTIRKEEKVTKTIPIPYYCTVDGDFMKVTEAGIVSVCVIDKHTGELNYSTLEFYSAPLGPTKKEKVLKATEITEYEFEIELNKAIDSIKSSVAA
jgi:hypothetical protein